MSAFFPSFIRELPRPDTAVAMDARIVPSEHVLTMFFEVDDSVEVPAHRHGAQWGVVLDGTLELEIDGATRTYRRGDTYFVPGGAWHAARLTAGYKGIDVFADVDRYAARPPAGGDT